MPAGHNSTSYVNTSPFSLRNSTLSPVGGADRVRGDKATAFTRFHKGPCPGGRHQPQPPDNAAAVPAHRPPRPGHRTPATHPEWMGLEDRATLSRFSVPQLRRDEFLSAPLARADTWTQRTLGQ